MTTRTDAWTIRRPSTDRHEVHPDHTAVDACLAECDRLTAHLPEPADLLGPLDDEDDDR